jgi:hemerythrin-like domain-containing protein
MGAGLILSGCERKGNGTVEKKERTAIEEKKEAGVTATEDLMREHGLLRRALLVYSAASVRLRASPSAVPPDVLQKTANLFRAFGEEYHEKKLEEAYIFPAVKKAGGEAGSYAYILVVQHNRGREITDYVLSLTQNAKFSVNSADELAKALEAFVLMYRNHAAREDTIVFPAWKKTLPPDQLGEMSEKFEDIEHQQFGEDGFDDAVKQISAIENSLGLADIAQFTAPPPPKI